MGITGGSLWHSLAVSSLPWMNPKPYCLLHLRNRSQNAIQGPIKHLLCCMNHSPANRSSWSTGSLAHPQAGTDRSEQLAQLEVTHGRRHMKLGGWKHFNTWGWEGRQGLLQHTTNEVQVQLQVMGMIRTMGYTPINPRAKMCSFSISVDVATQGKACVRLCSVNSGVDLANSWMHSHSPERRYTPNVDILSVYRNPYV